MIRLIQILALLATLTSCNQKEVLHFRSVAGDNSLTVITSGMDRYVVPGIVTNIPSLNFAKFDIQSVSDIGDGIWICWHGRDGWDLTIDNAVLVESDLDPTKFELHTSLPLDERKIPTERKYRQTDCAIFVFYTMSLSPDTGAVVEIVD